MIKYIISAIVTCCISSPTWASCLSDGKSSQRISLSIAGQEFEQWEVDGSSIRNVLLPKGFKLGVKIEPATGDVYRRSLKNSSKGASELVKISLYDMSADSPKMLSTTWGGSNSIQSFGPRGGANRVSAMGEQVDFWFQKAICISPETISAMQ